MRLHAAATGICTWPTRCARCAAGSTGRRCAPCCADCARRGEDGWPCWSFSNHDVERAISRWNPRRGEAPPDPRFARLLMALLLSLARQRLPVSGRGARPDRGRARARATCATRSASPTGPNSAAATAAARRCPGRMTARMAASPPATRPGCRCPAAHQALAVSAQEADRSALAARLARLPPLPPHASRADPGHAAPARPAGTLRRLHARGWGRAHPLRLQPLRRAGCARPDRLRNLDPARAGFGRPSRRAPALGHQLSCCSITSRWCSRPIEGCRGSGADDPLAPDLISQGNA